MFFRYLFRSGNHEHPSDKFYNTTVEVLPDQLNEESMIWQQYNTTTDGFLIVGSFNGFGVAEGNVDNRIGKLRELRLHVHSESENWVILSEVSLIQKLNQSELFLYRKYFSNRFYYKTTRTQVDH